MDFAIPSLQNLEKWLKMKEEKHSAVAMLSTHLSYSSLPGKWREDINIKGSFTKFEESMVEEPDMLKFQGFLLALVMP